MEWVKGTKYTSTSRRNIILQKKLTNKKIVGNRAVGISGMSRINSGTVDSSRNGINTRASGSRISVKRDGQGRCNL